MEIIIDTNILFNDWILRSDDSKAFLDFVGRTGSVIYIPRIVWEETRKNYREEIANKHAAYVKASRQFGRSLIEQPELKKIEIDFDEEADKYMDWLRQELRFDGLSNVLPYGDFTERIAKRAMAKRKPFNMQNNNEYKDTLLWETVLDIVSSKAGRGDEEVVLISNDSNAFGAGRLQHGQGGQIKNQKGEKQKGVLDPQLEEDIQHALEEGKGSNFYYYESFADFLASHYIPIKGIDKNSVKGYLEKEESGFEYHLLQGLTAKQQQLIALIAAVNPEYIDEINVGSIGISEILSIDDFYVYPFQKGEIATASGIALVHVDTEVYFGYKNRRNKRSVVIRPIVEVKFNLPYVDGKPCDIHFEAVTIQSGIGVKLPTEFELVETRIEKLSAQISKLNSSYYINSPLEVAKKIIDSIYEKKESFELWTIDDLESVNSAVKQPNFSRSESKYIPITAKSPAFNERNSTVKRRKRKKN
jgi:predicted nucleic acid-binding protein